MRNDNQFVQMKQRLEARPAIKSVSCSEEKMKSLLTVSDKAETQSKGCSKMGILFKIDGQ
jgi:hypothetical protein